MVSKFRNTNRKKPLNFSLSLDFIADSKVQKNILILPTFPVFASFWFI